VFFAGTDRHQVALARTPGSFSARPTARAALIARKTRPARYEIKIDFVFKLPWLPGLNRFGLPNGCVTSRASWPQAILEL
jgi:hypothetical protein